MKQDKARVPGWGDFPDAVPGIRDVFGTVLETVTSGIARAAGPSGKAGKSLLQAVTEVVHDSVREAIATGSDLVLASKAMMLGALRGSAEQGDAALQTVSSVATTIVRQTADRGGDLAAATKGIILGAIAGAKAIGTDGAGAAATAAKGALDGASQAGSVTLERVLVALKEPIGGIQVAISASQAR